MRRVLLAAASAVALTLASPVLHAKSAKDIPVETFLKRAQYASMVLSPDGSKLAALVPSKGRNNLAVINLAKRSRYAVTSFDAYDVADFYWVNNQRLCFAVADGQDVTGNFNYRGSYCINEDGTKVREFSQFAQRGLTLLARTTDDSPKAYVSMNQRSRDSSDVYLLDTENGRSELLSFDSPGRVRGWVLDRNNVPRIAVSVPERANKDALQWTQVWHRDGKDAKWEKLWEYNQFAEGDKRATWQPLAFDWDNTTLYVATNAGRDKMAIYKYDTKSKKLGDVVFEHPLIDVQGGLIFSEEKKQLVGVRYSADIPTVKWFDADMEKLQRQLDQTFKGKLNTMLPASRKENMALVLSSSDTDPGQYHLLDMKGPSIEPVVSTREWLDPALMSERRFITYKARDGLDIPAWLTIPKGSSGKNLPLIVHVHGGPHVRVYRGGFDLEAQWFASRGFAVLQPEPRASTGFGRKHYESGFKQWGLAMQDDLNDGALHLVKQGIADPKKMCIFGGSYGGYAAAIGAARDPDLWACSAPFIAVTDLTLLQTSAYSDTAQLTDYFETDFKRLVGDHRADGDLFDRTSAVKLASRVKAPVFLSMGSADVRVPIAHGTQFKSALERAGKKVEYVVYNGEGHGYNKDENRFDFYGRLARFFEENLK